MKTVKSHFVKFFLVVLIVFNLTNFAYPYMRGHTYFNGIIEGLTNEEIVISGKPFKISKRVEIFKWISLNGSIIQSKADFSELNVGVRVTVKVFSGNVTAIYIEQYHRTA